MCFSCYTRGTYTCVNEAGQVVEVIREDNGQPIRPLGWRSNVPATMRVSEVLALRWKLPEAPCAIYWVAHNGKKFILEEHMRVGLGNAITTQRVISIRKEYRNENVTYKAI